jgi:c-di-GMP-binding flagellar brake protein YcgR
MNLRRRLTQESAAQMFTEAVRERALAVLSLQCNHDWRTFKSRFLECDFNQSFFVLDYQAVNEQPLPELWPGQCVGVSFRSRNRKVLFATVVEARGHYMLEGNGSVAAIRYRWPQAITELQRRAYYRTPVPEGMVLVATLWRGGLAKRADVQVGASSLVAGTLANISCGGALVRLNQPAAIDWTEGELLGLEVQLGDHKSPALLDAYFRGLRQDEANQSGAALQFIGLELSVEGRLVLQRLANVVQKFHRQAITAGAHLWQRPTQE